MRYDKILVPLDGSRQAEYILPQLEAMVEAFDAEVTLLHVVTDGSAGAKEFTRSQKDSTTLYPVLPTTTRPVSPPAYWTRSSTSAHNET